jgi:hypothetical protein
MNAEAWVALGIGITTIVGTIIWAVVMLSLKIGSMIASFEIIGKQQTIEITSLKIVSEKIDQRVEGLEIRMETIAVDRERAAGLEKRVSKLETWYDELRRGIGVITQHQA